jgi:hypothetical protein
MDCGDAQFEMRSALARRLRRPGGRGIAVDARKREALEAAAWKIGCGSVAALVVLVIGFLILAPCQRGIVTECNYGKVKIGMRVSEVEAILGPGEEVELKYVPTVPPWGPVISGEKFFSWEDHMKSRSIWVGVRSGKVCSKRYFAPSL